jgi:type IV secretory pathway VirB10-like protein
VSTSIYLDIIFLLIWINRVKYTHLIERNPIMELLIGLVALIVIGYFLFFYKKPDEAQSTTTPETTSAPYKVLEPAATTPIPLVVEEVQPVAEAKVDPVAVALDLEPLTLSATAETAKKPRKPRAPKAETTTKPAAKKAAPVKKAAVKKPAVKKTVSKKA